MDVMDYQRIQRFGFDKQAILDACYIQEFPPQCDQTPRDGGG